MTYELKTVLAKQRGHSVFTLSISGIDGSGKGFISQLLEKKLSETGLRVATINIDPWQNPIPIRLKEESPAENFYKNVFRWDDFFKKLIIPLKKKRHISLSTQLIRTDADEYYEYTYEYKDLDIIIIEGILLFQQQFEHLFDYKIWIECSFETALKRAIQRNSEKLDEARLIHDYHTFYYPAQRLHFELDNPQKRADIIFNHEEDI